LGLLGETAEFAQVVGTGDPVDMYRFELDEPKRLQLRLAELTEDLQLALIADLNNNGAWDAGETIDDSIQVGLPDEFLLEDLVPGVYFVAVTPRNAGDNSAYRLSFRTDTIDTSPAFNPGDTPASAYDIGLLDGEQQFRGV